MSRIVSVWLPRWPILRFLVAQAKKPSDKPVDPDQPFVLAVTGAGGPRIAALNEAAEAFGLMLGEPLADAPHHMPGAVLVKDLPFLWVGACGDLPGRPSFELSEVLVSSGQAAGGDQDAS